MMKFQISLHWYITWEFPETSVDCSFVPVQEAWRTPPDMGDAAYYHPAPQAHMQRKKKSLGQPGH